MTNHKEIGGTKHYKYKTHKIKFYRKAIRSLKRRGYKTRAAKTRKQHRLLYLKQKLRDLTSAPRHHSVSHKRRRSHRHKRASSPTVHNESEIITDKYISPRIISIQPTNVASAENMISPSSGNSVPMPSSPSPPPSTQTELDLSGIEEEIENTDVSIKTDNSFSIPTATETTPSVPTVSSVQPVVQNIEPTPDSLHLSELNVSPPSQDSMASQQTTMETK